MYDGLEDWTPTGWWTAPTGWLNVPTAWKTESVAGMCMGTSVGVSVVGLWKSYIKSFYWWGTRR